MFLKTNIPETTVSLVGDVVDFGDRMFDQDEMILNDRTNKIQAIISGNRCGHVPDAPRFFCPPENHKRRPPVLDRAIDKMEVVYRKAKKFFKKLATTHVDGRQVRSERREATVSVAQVLLHYLDLSTLKVGFYVSPNKFIHLDLEYIAQKAGLSFSRSKRAINALEEQGYINVTRQYKKKEDGTFEGEPSIRKINLKFFIDLGVDIGKLLLARDWKRKKEEKAKAKAGLKKLKGMVQAVASFSSHLVSSKTKKQRAPSINQDLISKALALHRENPERSPSEYLAELQRLNE